MDEMTNPMDKLHGYYFEDLEVGMHDVFAKTVTDADIMAFAGISGDTNPVHLNHEFASLTMFEGRIAHGMLSASFISAVIGTRLPGTGAIYLSQNLRFRAPVKPGDLVTARVRVISLDQAKRRATLACSAHVGETLAIDGDALVMIPSRGETDSAS